MSGQVEIEPVAGSIAPDLRDEFPGLRLDWVTVPGRRAPSTPAVKRRLRDLSSRYRGANVIAMRTQAIPHAYRTFFRQIGLDPDVNRIPSEQVAVDRLLHGGFRAYNLVDDALLIALVETGVPVAALDADALDGTGLGIRTTVTGERLGTHEYADYLPPGRLVIADASSVHALLFGDVAAGHDVRSHTSRIAVYAVGVEGVPAIHVEEALWCCLEVLQGG
jgi:DNA/RNA-binding domain of Phe-tRNA-synthetase-like protein